MDCQADSHGSLQRRLVLALWLLALGGCGSATTDDASPSRGGASAGGAADAEQIAEKMLARYREASSYFDHAEYVQRSVLRSEGVERELPFFQMSVAFKRPNRLRLRFEEAVEGSAGRRGFDVGSDGTLMRSTAGEFAGQVQESTAPSEITVENLLPDPLIRQVFNNRSLGDVFPQLAMLLNSDDQMQVFPQDESPRLLEEQTLGERPCYRIATTSPKGRRILWIDRETYALLRMELPIEAERSVVDADNRYSQLSVRIDFKDATFDGEIDDDSFTVPVADGARRVRRFVAPPPPAPPAELGAPLVDFEFKNEKGEAITPASLRGRAALLAFWQLDCAPCKAHTPELDAIYRELQADKEFAFYAVSLDGGRVGAAAAVKTLRDWGGSMPVLLDPEKHAVDRLGVEGTPTLMLLDRAGRLQHVRLEQISDAASLRETIRQVQRGDDLAAIARAEHKQLTKDYQAELDAVTIKEAVLEIEVAPPEIAARRMPEKFTASELWATTSETLAHPGNLVALPVDSPAADAGATRILVVDGGAAVVEFNGRGENVARHVLQSDGKKGDGEVPVNGFLRILAGAEGATHYAVSGVGWQHVRVFDGAWKPVLGFPKERHAGLADVQWLSTAGEPRLAVGYWGGVGVQGVGLDGRRRWSERTLEQVVDLTFVPAEGSRPAELWCTGNRGTILVLDERGKPLREVEVAGHSLMQLSAALVDGAWHGCGLAVERVGRYAAVGFTAAGELQWQFQLPPGEYARQVERVQRVTLPGGAAAWMIAVANGDILWLNDEGGVIDQFRYGEPLTGLALTNSSDGAILVVGTTKNVTAWRLAPQAP